MWQQIKYDCVAPMTQIAQPKLTEPAALEKLEKVSDYKILPERRLQTFWNISQRDSPFTRIRISGFEGTTAHHRFEGAKKEKGWTARAKVRGKTSVRVLRKFRNNNAPP